MDKIGEFIGGIIESVKSFVIGLINDLKKIIIEPLFVVVDLLKNLKEIIVDFIDDFISDVEAIIKRWIEKNLIYLIDKIGDFINQVW